METDLFGDGEQRRRETAEPLACRMRPATLDEFTGQEHILGEGSLLRRLMKADHLASLIFYGPPGTGKTSLVHVIAGMTRSHFESINAVSSGVTDIRRKIEQAGVRLTTRGQRTILFIDEIHRFNKAQQDVLLPHVERGTVVLIGTTVENPFFTINAPLLSRSHVFELKPLSRENLQHILQRVLADAEKGLGKLKLTFEDEALEFLIDQSEGDARRFLNSVESVAFSTSPDDERSIRVTKAAAQAAVPTRILRHDRSGDLHYDVVSAFIKSMRGSDPDATLYWMARMISAGEDPRFIARRILICAAEDVGNADPQALIVAGAALTAAQFVGLPEARIPLAQAAVYVATAPKSNAASVGISRAMEDVHFEKQVEVPSHLRQNVSSQTGTIPPSAKYKYPHDYQNGYVNQEYMPGNKAYYHPSDRGYEAVIRKRMEMIHRRMHSTLLTGKQKTT